MDIINETMDIKDFMRRLEKVPLEDIEVPRIYIPNWPKLKSASVVIRITLGVRRFLFPVVIKKSGFLKLEQRRRRVRFKVYGDGSFGFSFELFGDEKYDYFRSDEQTRLNRIKTILMFHQFKEEILPEVIQRIEVDSKYQSQVVLEVKKALEPFIPFLVADELNK